MAIRVLIATRIAGLTGAVLTLGVGAAPAVARPVTLWACHGPLGQPLGMDGLAASSSADGSASAPGQCADPRGLVASFTRADPAGGSSASWAARAPDATTLSSVAVRRAVTPAVAPYGDGTPQRYFVRGGASVLDAVNLLDVWGAPSGTFTAATSADAVSAGAECARPADERCVAAAPGSVSAGAIALTVDDAAAPSGSVAGLRSPVRGVLALQVSAADDGTGLASMQAIVDGSPAADVALGCPDLDPETDVRDVGAAGCARSVTRAALDVDLTGRSVGAHRLQVRVLDAAGNASDLFDGQVAVAGPDPVFSPTAELLVGDPRAGAAGSGGAVGASSGAGSSLSALCPRPRLSMALDQKPLRVAHGRPVLRRGARYRFRGRLTCRPGKVRRSAPRGTPVEILTRRGTRVLGRTGATTMKGGRLTVILAYRTSRSIVFRHRSSTGTSSVRIRVTVAARRSS